MNAQRVCGTFENLVRVRIIERIIGPMLTFHQAAGYGKIINPACLFALPESVRNRDLSVRLNPGRPELVRKLNVSKRYRPNRIIL